MSSRSAHDPQNHEFSAGVGKLRPAGRMWPARSFYDARGHLQKYKPCSLVLTVEMAWAEKTRYQFLKSLSTVNFLLNVAERS